MYRLILDKYYFKSRINQGDLPIISKIILIFISLYLTFSKNYISSFSYLTFIYLFDKFFLDIWQKIKVYLLNNEHMDNFLINDYYFYNHNNLYLLPKNYYIVINYLLSNEIFQSLMDNLIVI